MSGPIVNTFPVNIETPDGTITGARLYVADGKATVYAENAGGIYIVTEADGVSVTLRPDQVHTHALSIEGGAQWLVETGGGCGCGSRLKRFDPSRAAASIPRTTPHPDRPMQRPIASDRHNA